MKEPIIFDRTDGQELRINMISPWLKKHFAEEVAGSDGSGDGRTLKIVKLSLDGGFTCPNRDGSKGTGGCLFCSESGSGDMASSMEPEKFHGDNVYADNIEAAMQRQIRLLSDKWPADKYNLKFIAYFQSHTNTYAPVEKLRKLFETAIRIDGVCGLAIATRSDCVPDDVLELLSELNGKTFMWVELGLQTIHDETARQMNLCHSLSDYNRTVSKLAEKNIRTVTHLILGLPGETEKMMLDSVEYVCRKTAQTETGYIFGIKLHMLNIVKGSGMEKTHGDYVPFETLEDYVGLLIKAVEIIPPEITLHRISGDAPRSTLISPEWSYRKRTILNTIHRTMRERNTWQGRRVPNDVTGDNKTE